MANKLELLIEAEKRGILPENKKVLLTEARKRGLIGGEAQAKQYEMSLLGLGKNILNEAQGISDTLINPMARNLEMMTGQTTPEAAIQSIEQSAQQGTLLKDIGGRALDTITAPVKGAVDLVTHPIKTAYENPISTLMALYPAGAMASKGLGKVVGKFGKLPISKRVGLMKESTSAYRDILRPTQGEVQNLEIRGKKNINDFYKLAAQEKLPIESTGGIDPKLETSKARSIIQNKQELIHKELNNILEKSDKKFNLDEVAYKAMEELKSKFKNASEYKEAVSDVAKFVDDEIEKFGSNQVTAKQFNEFKQGMWKVGYNQMKPTADKTARTMGHIAKETIENEINDAKVRELNNKSSQYSTLENLLGKAQGRVIQGGKMGKYFAKLGTAAVGEAVGESLGVPGVGAGAGYFAGKGLSEFLSDPARISANASTKMARAMTGKGKLYDIGKALERPGNKLIRGISETQKANFPFSKENIIYRQQEIFKKLGYNSNKVVNDIVPKYSPLIRQALEKAMEKGKSFKEQTEIVRNIIQ